MIGRVIALGVLLVVAGCGPVLIFPGGKLDGISTQAPQDWSFTDDIKTIQLETQPSDPYSVNIWVVAIGSSLYVHAGDNRATWVEHMEVNSNVRLRVDGKIYDLVATRVDDPPEFALFSDVYETKYDRRPRNDNIAEVYLFRLSGPS